MVSKTQNLLWLMNCFFFFFFSGLVFIAWQETCFSPITSAAESFGDVGDVDELTVVAVATPRCRAWRRRSNAFQESQRRWFRRDVVIFVTLEDGWLWMVMDDYGWLWMVMDDYGWLWMVMDGYGWLWMVMDGYGWLWFLSVLSACMRFQFGHYSKALRKCTVSGRACGGRPSPERLTGKDCRLWLSGKKLNGSIGRLTRKKMSLIAHEQSWRPKVFTVFVNTEDRKEATAETHHSNC